MTGMEDTATRARTGEGDTATVRVGFMPLVDCAPLVVAREKGFAALEGLKLDLARETSWANIRDRLVVGHFDAAHMPAPMPIAASLGVGPLHVAMAVPMVLSLGGNAITVSNSLWRDMCAAADEPLVVSRPKASANALARVVAAREAAGEPPLTFAIVHPFSGHNYDARYWLASAGIHPDEDVRLIVVPPPFMADALAAGQVDGFCVGEPWSSRAVESGIGRIVTTKAALWRQGPEKVLSFRADWVEREPELLAAVIRAVWKAACWADEPENRAALADMLSDSAYLGVEPQVIARALSGRLVLEHGQEPVEIPDFMMFRRSAATFPWRSHALWIYSQIVRWGQVEPGPEMLEAARRTYRPDLYRRILGPLGVTLPNASMKVEGALTAPTPVASSTGRMVLGPDGFFDGQRFDPDDIEGYMAGFAIRTKPL
ncbi:MAG: CmpA/NrtA family ABC transporter substrate-binding protein [Pseudomonadota bacterium]|nr:CmpA/NrtA family ABC transporter substrate-binding protein [Pseudomonadota bacterium]